MEFVKILHVNCSVKYSGRGDTTLAPHDRIVMMKDDGSVSVHSGEGVKPLNYMGAKAKVSEEIVDGERVLMFDSSKENLTVTIHRLINEIEWEVEDGEPGLVRDGTESDLQEWLSKNMHAINNNLEFVEREYSTGAGPVDLYARDLMTGCDVLIEVKRVASSSAVYQIRRYLEGHDNPQARGMIVALDVRPRTRHLADKHGIEWVEVNYPTGHSPASEVV